MKYRAITARYLEIFKQDGDVDTLFSSLKFIQFQLVVTDITKTSPVSVLPAMNFVQFFPSA